MKFGKRRFCTQRGLVALLSAIFLALTASAAEANPLIRRTESGLVRGYQSYETLVFKGIPYALPPVGERRWRAPAAPAPWTDIKEAYYFGSPCMQPAIGGIEGLLSSKPTEAAALGSEDCLTLNVWAPKNKSVAGKYPVLVFLHGGSNVTGSTADKLFRNDIYDGALLSQKGKAVVVTLNYRLGALGFLAHPLLSARNGRQSSGNFGQLDQLAALQWVQRNIDAFGGDTKRVLLFGESAGALDSLVLYASPLAKGLFSRVLLQSVGYSDPFPTQSRREAEGEKFAHAIHCGGNNVLSCLQEKSAEELVLANVNTEIFAPGVDGYLLEEPPLEVISAGRQNRAPLVVGATESELSYLWPAQAKRLGLRWPPENEIDYQQHLTHAYTAPLARLIAAKYPLSKYSTPSEAEIAVASDYAMICPSNRMAKAAFRSQADPVWQYLYTHVYTDKQLAPYKAAHGFELPMVFGNFPGFPQSWFLTVTPEEYQLSETMMDYWTKFAGIGNPNGTGPTTWPEMGRANLHLNFDENLTVGSGDFHNCTFWDELHRRLQDKGIRWHGHAF